VKGFAVGGKNYPAGSFVVKSAQAFRPHLLSMFEPQDHPNDFTCPGGPPIPPYDNAGWTLAYQMGVQFDRILDAFDGPFEKIPDIVKPKTGLVRGNLNSPGYVQSHKINDGFIAVNRLLAAGEDVYWLKAPSGTERAGLIYIPAGNATRGRLEKIAAELGLEFAAVEAKPAGEALKLKPVRIGVWDQYGGSMSAGWMRWLLERFEFPFELVYAPALDAGGLKAKYDVLILVGGAIPRLAGPEDPIETYYRQSQQIDPKKVPAEYQGQIGAVSLDKTIPRLKEFLEDGGTILTLSGSTSLAYALGLPVENALTEQGPGGAPKPLPVDKFYVPGSVLRVTVDTGSPIGFGMPESADVMFDNSPAFKLLPDAELKGVKPIAWFDSDKPLRSGWAWGQNYLKGSVAVIDALVGKGRLVLYGPEVIFRGQPHGTFKLLFNGIFCGAAELVVLK